MTHILTHNLFELHSPNGDGPRVASLNVKVRRVSSELAAIINDDEHAAEEFANFWWSTASIIVGEFGFGAEQHGRSGGWLVFTLNGRAITADDLDTRGLDAIEGNAPRSLAARLNRAAARVLDILADVALINLAVDLGLEEDGTTCDECGGPCDADDAVTDDCVNLCGSLHGNGCADTWHDAGAMFVDGVLVARTRTITL